MSESEVKFRPPSWSAPPRARAWLEVRRTGDDSAPPLSTVPLDAPHTTFGRGGGDVRVDDSAASRLHAALVHHQDGKWYLIDLGASNGTLVDGFAVQKHRPLRLRPGFGIRFGGDKAQLVYTLHTEEGVLGSAKRPSDSAAPGSSKRAREVDASGETVRASHLLVKHRDSRRPSSAKEPNVTRSKQEALQMLAAFQQRLLSGEVAFAELAARESHCSSASRGGDLGIFGRGKMQKPFEEAAFALQVGHMSGPVDTDSGVHLILRTE